MPKLDRDGVNIHYEVHGKGPTILLSHGYSSTSRMWEGQVAALKDRYQVVVWDFRGHGESDYPKDPARYSEELTVGDMAALLDLVGARKAIVAGLSLGGYMSLAFNASHPERVAALMLFDTGPGFKKDEARAKWNESAHKRAADFDERGLAALNSSDEVKLTRHRDASGLAGSARGMLAQKNDRVIQSLDGPQPKMDWMASLNASYTFGGKKRQAQTNSTGGIITPQPMDSGKGGEASPGKGK